MKYTIYTDGACSGNPGPGGWGAVIFDETKNNTIFQAKLEKLQIIGWNYLAPIMALKKIKYKSEVVILQTPHMLKMELLNG